MSMSSLGRVLLAESILSTAAEPKWKFRFTEAMRLAVLGAVETDEEMTQLILEKQ